MVQMPGLTTPQFDQVRTTLRRRPRPVAPVWQPEVAADAIAFATKRKRPLLAAAALALALLAAGAGSASAEIVPQQSIAGVSVDMTEQQVVQLLGEPGNVHSEYGGPSGEDFFTTYRYGKRGIKIRFLRKRAGNRVTTIEVYKGRQEVTATGIGLKSRRAKVKAEVAGSRCKRYDKTYAICTVGRGEVGDIQTTFWLNRRDKVKLVTLGRILYF